jgi:hypothetical protein
MTGTANELAARVAALGLADPQVCVPHLCRVMERIECTAAPAEFLGFVNRAYQHASRTLIIPDAPFHKHRSHVVFKAGLVQASQFLRDDARILVVGCGDDMAGRNADYAVQVARDVISPRNPPLLRTWNMTRADLVSPSRWDDGSPFDLIVTNSLLHFAAELGATLHRISSLLAKNGMYLMAHEPNARFWSNSVLRDERQDMSADTTVSWRRRVFMWSAYSAKLRTLLAQKPAASLETIVNQYLAEKYGLRGDLAAHEIAAIVDPHRPSAVGDGFRIGLNGFNEKQLSQLWQDDPQILWTQSYDHLGPIDYSELPPKWKKRERELAGLHPADGSSWTALWKVKRAA